MMKTQVVGIVRGVNWYYEIEIDTIMYFLNLIPELHNFLYKFDDLFNFMVENNEKLCFLFFALLPPYIGVSGFLVYAKR